MSSTTRIAEIMNLELFSVAPDDEAEKVLRDILNLGISSAPVLDRENRPIGVVSLCDLARRRGEDEIGIIEERMTVPALTIPLSGTVDTAAQLMSAHDIHHLVVVDGDGRAVGHLSALDLVRALSDQDARHPWSVPHQDRRSGYHWSETVPLERSALERAPSAPGLLVLIHTGPGSTDRVIWGEYAPDLRERLEAMLSEPERQDAALATWLERGGVRFRAARLPARHSAKAAQAEILRQMGVSPEL